MKRWALSVQVVLHSRTITVCDQRQKASGHVFVLIAACGASWGPPAGPATGGTPTCTPAYMPWMPGPVGTLGPPCGTPCSVASNCSTSGSSGSVPILWPHVTALNSGSQGFQQSWMMGVSDWLARHHTPTSALCKLAQDRPHVQHGNCLGETTKIISIDLACRVRGCPVVMTCYHKICVMEGCT